MTGWSWLTFWFDHAPLDELKCLRFRSVLRLDSPSPDLLFDALLPDEAKLLPGELGRLDELLGDPKLLDAFAAHWRKAGADGQVVAIDRGRPTIAMATYLRLMVLKHRSGFGYETLMRAVADSLHLRRFCRIPLSAPVPDESTVRKLTRRLGPELVDELTLRSSRRPLLTRSSGPGTCGSTPPWPAPTFATRPTPAWPLTRCGSLARAARKVAAAVPKVSAHVRDRSRAVGRRMRALTRTLRRRSGEARADLRRLTEAAAAQVKASVREADKMLAQAKRSRSRSRSVSAKARAQAIAALAEIIASARKVIDQVAQRFAGDKITSRLVCLFDTDARPIRRGKLDRPNEFGYVVQLAEVAPPTPNQALAASCFPPSWKPDPPMRTPCCPPRGPSSNASVSRSKRPPLTPASSATRPSRSSPASRCSSSAAPTTPAPAAPGAAWPATGSAPKAASPT
jgi:IS5 family transposase